MSYKNGTLDQRHVDALESVPNWNWDPFVDQWNELFELLKSFVSREGHAQPKANHFEKDIALGSWVSTQRARHRRQNLPDEQRVKLESLPKWSWDPITDLWETSYELLEQYVAREGTALVPHGHIESDVNLGSWVLIQRQFYKKRKMSIDRIKRLESLAGWDWSPQESKTAANFQLLKQFIQEHGNSDVASGSDSSPVLKRWVQSVRSKYMDQTLDADLEQRLQSIEGWRWDYPNDATDEDQMHLDLYKKYVADTGSSILKKGSRFDGVDLHKWLKSIRARKIKGSLRIEIETQLEAIPYWDWNAFDHQWNENYADFREYLKTASAQELATGAIRNTQISTWLANQRAKKRQGELDNQKVMKLESVPNWTWMPLNDLPQWQKNFDVLKAYVDEYGSAKVSKKLVIDGFNVWQWINYQRSRYRKGELKAWQVSLLESLRDWDWNPSLSKNQ
jgi:hypothetical protein